MAFSIITHCSTKSALFSKLSSVLMSRMFRVTKLISNVNDTDKRRNSENQKSLADSRLNATDLHSPTSWKCYVQSPPINLPIQSFHTKQEPKTEPRNESEKEVKKTGKQSLGATTKACRREKERANLSYDCAKRALELMWVHTMPRPS